jgi:hypothetical protein
MSEQQTYEMLLGIHEGLGRLSAEVRGTNELLKGHIEDDKEISVRLQRVELSAASQRGSVKVVVAIATTLGAVVAFAVTSFLSWLGLRH